MKKRYIPYSTQLIDESDISAVTKALRSDFLTQGPRVAEFEKSLARYCGAKYCVVMSSGTAALHAACFAAGIKNGDEVITSPITFVASSNCVLYCGGKPVFADIEDDGTALISTKEIEKKLTSRTKAIIPVDYAGQPCDMDRINSIAKKNGSIVIEDAAHSLGATYKGRKVGTLADMTALSFHAVKHITTGEGGAVVTDNKQFRDRLIMFRTHGITRNVNGDGPWYYEMQELGFNYRLTDFQCALGMSQLKKLDKFVARRRKIASTYDHELSNIKGFDTPKEIEGAKSSYHLYPIMLKGGPLKRKLEIFNALREKGLGVNVHYIPVPMQPYYRKTFGYKAGDFPVAEAFYKSEISIPIHQKMDNADVKAVISTVKEVIK